MAVHKDLHVIILGAGTTGLLIAQGLKKNNISFSIYECEDEDKYKSYGRDWSMALFWAADYITNTLPDNLRDRFDEIKSDPFDIPGPERLGTLPLYNGKTAELVVNIPGGVATRVSRGKLRKLFSEDLDIQFGKSASKIEEHGDKVVITFEDGSTATGSTVVCCDGIKGLGRTVLLGEEKAALTTAPCSIVNVCNKYTTEQARFIRSTLDPVYKFAGHPDQPTLFLMTSVDVPDLDHPEDWKIQCLLTTWGTQHAETNEERVRIFKEAASKYAEPWRSAVLWLPDDTYIPPDRIRYWADPVIWPNWDGKITLAGDAAHPMTPFRGQGLNNALQDSHNYVAGISAVHNGERALSDVITEYSNESLERGAKEIELSSMWGPTLHDWNTLMNTPMMKQGYGKKEELEKSADGKAEAEKGTTTAEIEQRAATVAKEAEDNANATGATISPTATSDASEIPSRATQPPTLAVESKHLPPTPPSDSPIDKSKGPTTTELEQQLADLKLENESLKKHNSLLLENLKAVAALVDRSLSLCS